MAALDLRKVDLLDPRSASDAPIADSVNIPAGDLAVRVYELPPKDSPLKIADLPGGKEAIQWMKENGRIATLTGEFVYGEPSRCRLWSPNEFLSEVNPHLTMGRALDLGCGVGREAVFLASLGWAVTAVDKLPDALDRGRLLAARCGVEGIEWIIADVESDLPTFAGHFDLITMFLFYDLDLVRRALCLLAPGGSLVLESFSEANRLAHGRPKDLRRAIQENLKDVLSEMELKVWSEGERAGRHTVRVWAKASSQAVPRRTASSGKETGGARTEL